MGKVSKIYHSAIQWRGTDLSKGLFFGTYVTAVPDKAIESTSCLYLITQTDLKPAQPKTLVAFEALQCDLIHDFSYFFLLPKLRVVAM